MAGCSKIISCYNPNNDEATYLIISRMEFLKSDTISYIKININIININNKINFLH